MKVLYIGGTGEISYACVHASARAGHQVTVFNRGRSTEPLPQDVRQVLGDVTDPVAYGALAAANYDVICQFTAYAMADIERDARVFAGHTGQYVFISTASAYEKPPRIRPITEDVTLRNPFWPYSQAKADMEARLWQWHGEGKPPVTVVRPSHTYRRRFFSTFMAGDEHAWRMLNGKAVICHGDGQSLWTYTHADDFAVPFVRLLGEKRAVGQAYHVVTDSAYTWDELFQAAARALDVEPRIVHVPSDTLVRYNREWMGPLLGDKSWTAVFDTRKLRSVAGPLPTPMPLDEGYQRVLPHFRERMKRFEPDVRLHELVDRIADEQTKLGS